MNEADFIAKDGQRYSIAIDDWGERITVRHNGTQVGFITLRLVEGDDIDRPESYFITQLSLNGCRSRGIGRRCLQFHTEMFGARLVAGHDTGPATADGSLLRGDAPAFIARMRAEGIVDDDARTDNDRFDD